MSNSSRNRVFYSSSFKLSVVQEFLSGGHSKHSLCKKYSLASTSTLRSWIRIFAPEFEPIVNDMKKKTISESEELVALRRLLAQTQLELKREKMRADFNDEMINVAEEMFHIPIRKKAGTKQ